MGKFCHYTPPPNEQSSRGYIEITMSVCLCRLILSNVCLFLTMGPNFLSVTCIHMSVKNNGYQSRSEIKVFQCKVMSRLQLIAIDLRYTW